METERQAVYLSVEHYEWMAGTQRHKWPNSNTMVEKYTYMLFNVYIYRYKTLLCILETCSLYMIKVLGSVQK